MSGGIKMVKKLKEDIKCPVYRISQEEWDELDESTKIEILILSEMDGDIIDEEIRFLYGEKAVDYYRSTF